VRLALTALLWLVGAIFVTPLVWMAATSLKPANETLSRKVGLLPRFTDADHPEGLNTLSAEYASRLAEQTASNYAAAFESPITDFHLYIRNTLFVSTLSVIGMVLSSAIAAYGFSRIQWRGRDSLFLLVLATMMLPFTVVMAPQYLLYKHMGWIGTFLPLWLPAWFGGAFSVFLLRQFFLGIPRELDEAAQLDGCSHWSSFWRIILPLARPALAVAALLQFIASWNDFLAPLVFINQQHKYTLMMGLQMFERQHGGTPWNHVMAATFITMAPVLVLFVLAQRSLIEGVATQGLKE
jgi:multiple sugar transport system permease protein